MDGFWVPFLVPVVLFLVIKLRLTLIRSLTSIYSIIYSTESDSTHTIPTTYSVLGISNSLCSKLSPFSLGLSGLASLQIKRMWDNNTLILLTSNYKNSSSCGTNFIHIRTRWLLRCPFGFIHANLTGARDSRGIPVKNTSPTRSQAQTF